ncbi:neutral/alkaline non-lysosomal ceramidase N-terminal domain-containing protein [Paenibacillus cymbidii]|uniref:neutral/alkaline non-lysosomal ceramidase N-terminal domain-containing protein n=1 Tax=Paenibacillus cymbidii TaxID=1639034 RepID=UPI0014367916|nr:neutral/alkaline non-lysosomal ceramidase N-terminal domain-containing protein [Paenibacillus cymbidii]
MVNTLSAGFGRADISPDVGVELSGFGWYIGRASTGVLEPLYANAIVWEAGAERGAIVSCDLIGIGRELSQRTREIIAQSCGIPYDHILVCCTHTHSGPATMELIGWGEADEAYLRTLPERIAESARIAAGSMAATELAYGEVAVEGISYNRETHTKDRPGGETDRTLKAVKLLQNGRMAGFIVHYSCHPVVMCERTSLISGDFVGMAINALSARTGATGLFLQGALGDQNPVFCHDDQEKSLQNIRVLSDRFTTYIEAALAAAQPTRLDVIAVQREDIRLQLAVPDRSLIVRHLQMIGYMQKYDDSLPEPVRRRLHFEKNVLERVEELFAQGAKDELETEIQAIRFGNLLFVTHPSEIFYAFHREIEARLRPFRTFIVGMANDAIGYVPTADKYELNDGAYSYPAWFVPFMIGQFPFRSDVGKRLTENLVRLGTALQDREPAV